MRYCTSLPGSLSFEKTRQSYMAVLSTIHPFAACDFAICLRNKLLASQSPVKQIYIGANQSKVYKIEETMILSDLPLLLSITLVKIVPRSSFDRLLYGEYLYYNDGSEDRPYRKRKDVKNELVTQVTRPAQSESI